MIIYESIGAHAGVPLKALPRNHRIRKPMTSVTLAANLKRLAYTVRDRGYEYENPGASDKVVPRFMDAYPLSYLFRGGVVTVNKLVGIDLYQFIQKNSDVFLVPAKAIQEMSYAEFADFLDVGAMRLEDLK